MQGTKIPNIIDVVGSGDRAVSYPIEVGVVLANGQRYCSIIKPAVDWIDWDTNREAEHGITRDSLKVDGQAVEAVAQQLNQMLAGKTVYTYNHAAANACLEKLFQQCDVEMGFTLVQLTSIVCKSQMLFWEQIRQKLLSDCQIQRDRASNNAWIVQRCFVLSRQKMRSANVAAGSAIKRVG